MPIYFHVVVNFIVRDLHQPPDASQLIKGLRVCVAFLHAPVTGGRCGPVRTAEMRSLCPSEISLLNIAALYLLN